MLYLWLLSQGLTIGSFHRIHGVADAFATRSFLDSLPLLFADNLKFIFISSNCENDLTHLINWNIANARPANHTETNTLTLKCVITVGFGMGTMVTVKSHENFSLIINGNLKWVDHVNEEVFKSRRSFYMSKSTVALKTPSKGKIQLYQSKVLSGLNYGSAICSPVFHCIWKKKGSPILSYLSF